MSKLVIILAVTIAVLAFFQWKGCEESKQAEADAEAALVQVKHWNAVADSAADRADSAVAGWGMEKVQWTKDSARMVDDYRKADTAINHEKGVFGALAAIHDAAKNRKDTAAQLDVCDSAFNELKKAKMAVTDLQTSSETIQTAFSNEIRQRDSTISVLAGSILQLRTAKDSLGAIAIDATKKLVKYASSGNKHWAVGPSVGAGYVGGKLQPIIGATVTYTIFRF